MGPPMAYSWKVWHIDITDMEHHFMSSIVDGRYSKEHSHCTQFAFLWQVWLVFYLQGGFL
jgi:hypothetical protein